MNEDQLETDTLSWLVELDYVHRHGADSSPASAPPESRLSKMAGATHEAPA